MPAPGGFNSNLFALLDDDDNEDSVPVKKEAAPAKPAPAKEHKSENQPRQSDKRERKGKGDNRRQGGKDRGDRSNEAYDGGDKPQKPGDNEGRGKGRRRYEDGEKSERKGKGKGRRREYDRHSGTGRGKGEAREGRGKYNWGEQTDQGAPADGAEASAENDAAPAIVEAPEPEPEEEDNTMSFEDYMKQQAEKKSKLPSFNERKIEKSEEPKGFKVDRNADQAGASDEMYGMIFHAYDGKHHGREKKEEREGWVVADDVLNMKFADPNSGGKGDRDRGDRRSKGGKKGGKGAERNTGGRGGGNRGNSRAQGGKIELDDASAFPSLA